MNLATKRSLSALITALVLSCATSAHAETLALNPALSFLKIEIGFVNELGFQAITVAQVPGSDLANLSGSMEVTLSGGDITFDAGSLLDFLQFDGGATPLLPAVGGGSPGNPGTPAPAEYGLFVNLPGFLIGNFAIRNGLAEVFGGPTPVLGGDTFDTTGLTLGITAGGLDVNAGGLTSLNTNVPIAGNSALNANGALGYTTIVNGMRYVVVPISLDVTISVEVSPGLPPTVPPTVIEVTARFTGQLVTVPEPSSMALLGLACAVIPVVGYRRLRRKS